MEPRLIPVLLIERGRLIKTTKFSQPVYVGDALNTVRILNEKEVDEIILLDVGAQSERRGPNLKVLGEIAGEAFMPLGYGGGIRNLEDATQVLQQGFEKIVLGRISFENPNLIDEMAKVFGSQSVVVCVDVEKKLFGGRRVRHASGSRRDPNCWIHECIKRGAGEIILQSVDRDGTRTGYDLSLYENLSADISVPVIALGGAGSLMDVQKVLTCRKVHSAAAGSLFVHQGPHRAVLISYPERTELQKEGILS